MTTLAASSNVTLALTDYDSVTISCRGPVTVEAVSGLGLTAGKIAEFDGTRTFGPFASAGSLKLTTQGAAAEYERADGAARGGAVEFAIVNGNVTGLAGPGGAIDIVRREHLTALPSGQALGLTRPVTKMGKKIFGFASADGWVKSVAGFGAEGTDYVTTEEYTGVDPTSGLIAGFASRAGATKLRKIQCLSTALIEIKKTAISVPINGRIGLWVYVECAAGVNNPSMSMILSSVNGSTANEYNFNNNQIKPNAWNFLAVVRSANPASNADKETHPFGLAESIGDYTTCQWVTQNLASLYLRIQGVVGTTFYFDSVWTAWEATPQFVLGADYTGADIINYVLPKFKQHGWKGYIAQPYRIQSGGWVDVADWNEIPAGTKSQLDACYAAGWDIINHSVNHQAIGGYTDPTQIRFEINACRAWLSTYGYNRGQEFYASPMGSSSVFSRKVIADCGIKMQRHGTHDANHVTAYGVDELTHVGGVDIGGSTWNYNGADPVNYPYNYPHIANLRKWVDMIIKYQATGMPFWHGVKVLGDPGDGTGNSADAVMMFRSTFDLFMDYIAEKEAAGLCRVTDGMTGFYYGSGR